MWVLVCLFGLASYLFYRWRKETFSVFEKLGISGPRPHLIWGNYFDFKQHHVRIMDEWIPKYGDTFGAYWGDVPIVVSKDVELIQKIAIKQFSKAPNRARQLALEDSHPFFGKMLILIKNDEWKKLRALFSPSFTARKLKDMLPLWQTGMDHLVEALDDSEEAKKGVDMYPFLKKLTLDNIGRTLFGIDANSHKEKANPILETANVFIDTQINGLPDILVSSFTLFAKVLKTFIRTLFRFGLLSHASDTLAKYCNAIVDARRKDGRKRLDLLQLLIDTEDTGNYDFKAMNESEEDPKNEANTTSTKAGVKLDNESIVGNTVLFVLAGYETTSTTLGFTLQYLARYPKYQQMLRDEMSTNMDINNIDYYQLVNLPLMEAVIHESLRLKPAVASFVTRESNSEIEHNGITYPAGMSFFFPAYQIHRDEKNFHEANDFYPERFLPENKPSMHPASYIGFGIGPRNCMGMRVALVQIKLALANILSRYELQVHEDNFKFSEKNLIIQPETVSIKLKRLN